MANSNSKYRPLPDSLTIKDSKIEGLGLFAKEDIPINTTLGISHLISSNGSLTRTPLGGFYNHSNEPNCIKKKVFTTHYLVSLKDIKAGEEITVEYTLYNPE
jgi:SET domain-containing protein